MSKSKEELDALKKEVESISEKLKELTPEELEQVSGGVNYVVIGHSHRRQYFGGDE